MTEKTKEEVMKKMELLMTEEERKRVVMEDCMETGRKDEIEMTVDVHGMSTIKAVRFVKNLIAITRDSFKLDIIHGYNNGHAIKDELRSGALPPRAGTPHPVSWNPGQTVFYVAGIN